MEPFKNLFSVTVIEQMADHLRRAWPPFDRDGFVAAASAGLDALELSARSRQIQAALGRFLPPDFPTAADVLLAALRPPEGGEGVAGMALLPMTHYVGEHGIGHFDRGLDALREMTKRFSAEFGIRAFLLADAPRCLKTLATWARDPDERVRRLVSEGTRPRLPWATRLPAFIADPSPVLPLLEALRDDPSEDVRRSVANHLNDIAKDHPDLVVDLAARWLRDAPPARERLVRHACRTLVKNGHPGALAALGHGRPVVRLDRLDVRTPRVRLGEALVFSVSIASEAETPQDLVIDYVIHHRKANGRTSPKVFKWKRLRCAAGEAHTAERRHPIRPITTRAYYPGEHFVEVQVNGEPLGRASFELVM